MAKSKYDMVIKGGRIIDPAMGFSQEADLFIKDGKISDIKKSTKTTLKEISRLDEENVIDAAGKLVTPGLIDMHVHLREPGQEDMETVATGTRSIASPVPGLKISRKAPSEEFTH